MIFPDGNSRREVSFFPSCLICCCFFFLKCRHVEFLILGGNHVMSKARCCNSMHQEELFENPWMLSCRSSQVILQTYVECRGWDNKGLRSTVWATSWASPSIERITAAFWRGWHISDHRYSSPFTVLPKRVCRDCAAAVFMVQILN